MSGAVRNNLIATISPTPYAKPLLLDLVSRTRPGGVPEFFVGVPVTQTALVGKGGAGAPYSYQILTSDTPSGSPPVYLPAPGLALDGLTGAITGTPTTQGVFHMVAQVEDSASNTFAHAFTINVLSGLTVVVGTPTPGEQDLPYQFQYIVRDLSGSLITSGFATSDALPDGLSLSGAGVISGTPTIAAIGITYFTVTVTDGSVSIDIPCSMTIYPILQFGASSVPDIIRGTSYSAFIHATGGAPPYRYSYGPVASGLDDIVMDGGTGDVSGSTDAAPGTYTGGMTIQDALGVIISQTTAWIVQDANRHIQPQLNSVDIGSANPKNFNFVDGDGTEADVTNDGTTTTVKFNISDAGVIRARLATAAALPTNVYNNGTSGVGATLTGVSVGALSVDGVAVALNDVVLVKNESTQANNGAYVVTTLGTVGVAYVLTRDTRMDGSTEFTGVLVTTGPEGSTNADLVYECTAVPPVTVGTTAITFQATGSTYTPPVTTKGDLFGYSSTPARVPVGANDLPLVADSSASLGVSYKALPITGGGTGQITRQAALNALAGTMTKGDILVSTGTNVVTHAHGTNGAIIQFDSSQTDGLVNIFSPFLPLKTLQAEILADTPTAYWRYNDSSGTTIVDSSGNGFNLTQQGTAGTGNNYVLAYQPLLRLESTPTLYVNNINIGGGCKASINPTSASVPSGSWTVMGIVRRSASATICPILQLNNNASSSNAIYCGLQSAAAGPFVQLIGTNFTVQAYTAAITNNTTYIYHFVKDAAAKTFTFYINGFLMGTTSYITEYSTTLTAPRTFIGQDFSGTASVAGIIGEVALFYGVTLAYARIQAHAQAAGLYGL